MIFGMICRLRSQTIALWIDTRGNAHFLMHYIPDKTLVARHAFAPSFYGPWTVSDVVPYVPQKSQLPSLGAVLMAVCVVGEEKSIASPLTLSLLSATHLTEIKYSRFIDLICLLHAIHLSYNTTVVFSDNTTTTFHKRERPHLAFDAYQRPTHLITGVVAPGRNEHGYQGVSYTLVQKVNR